MNQAKPFPITKGQVWAAYKRVKANGGSAGVDHQTLEDFAGDLKGNLYKLWNRLASGCYLPPPVKRVEIPKATGGTRPLGVPTVADRIAQTVIKEALEPRLELCFHPDAYGYRPGKSAKQALQVTRQRCWKYDWVLEYDISKFFEEIDHELLLRALRKHVEEKWILLYIERWLKAPTAVGGEVLERTRGTPQGGVISPLLANLFLHYVFDRWMARHHRDIPFARYADDGVVHCATLEQAEALKAELAVRFAECGLKLHSTKTRIVYCKDTKRRGRYPVTSFDFLGFTFRSRRARGKGGAMFVTFTPAISNQAAKAIRRVVRVWNLPRRSDCSLEHLAEKYSVVIRGWVGYYSTFCRSALYPTLNYIDRKLVLWATGKFKNLRGHRARATAVLKGIVRKNPGLFPHWKMLYAMAR